MNSSKIWRAIFCSQFATISLIFLTELIAYFQWYKKTQNFALKLYLQGITIKNLCPLPKKPQQPKSKKLRLRLFLVYLCSDMEEQNAGISVYIYL